MHDWAQAPTSRVKYELLHALEGNRRGFTERLSIDDEANDSKWKNKKRKLLSFKIKSFSSFCLFVCLLRISIRSHVHPPPPIFFSEYVTAVTANHNDYALKYSSE